MKQTSSFDPVLRGLIVVFGASAFLSIFATIDTALYYRAWTAARSWTTVQKAVAPAEDADFMYSVVLAALGINTAVIALAFAGGLTLGVAVATDRPGVRKTAVLFGLADAALGGIYSLLMIFFKIRLSGRKVLKGPIFDYDMTFQPPVIISIVAFFGVLIIALVVFRTYWKQMKNEGYSRSFSPGKMEQR